MNRWMRGGLLIAATLASVASVAPGAYAEGGRGVLSSPINKFPHELLTCISNELPTAFERHAFGLVCKDFHAYTSAHIKVVRNQNQLDLAIADVNTTAIVSVPDETQWLTEAPANHEAVISAYDNRTDDGRGYLVVFPGAKVDIIAAGTARVLMEGSGLLTVLDKSEVQVSDKVHVEASGAANVTAIDSVTVNAHDNASVTANGSGLIHAYDKSKVNLNRSSKVEAHDESEIVVDFWATGNAVSNSSSVRIFGLNPLRIHV